MALGKDETRDLYRQRARRYDLAVHLYRLAGFRVRHYREEAVRALCLRDGDTVVEIGCGTGLNFMLLEKRYLREVSFREFYFGALYLSVGTRDRERS